MTGGALYDRIAGIYDPWSVSVTEDVELYVEEALASGVPQHLVAIPLAVLLHEGFRRMRDAAVGAYFLPYITSTVAIAIMFSSLFSTDFGLVNATLAALFGVEPIDWLGRPENIKPAIRKVTGR